METDGHITPHQSSLLDFIHRINTASEANPLFRRSLQGFIFEYGWWYAPVTVSEEIAAGTRKQCFTNAAELALPDCSLVYCEGYAVFKTGHPTLHTWVTDDKGNAIDNTWPTPGIAYAGVPFTWEFVMATTKKNHAFLSLLEDWQNKWPLRGDLGDRPEEWLDGTGDGERWSTWLNKVHHSLTSYRSAFWRCLESQEV